MWVTIISEDLRVIVNCNKLGKDHWTYLSLVDRFLEHIKTVYHSSYSQHMKGSVLTQLLHDSESTN